MRQARGRCESSSGTPWAVRRRSSCRFITWGDGVGVGVGVVVVLVLVVGVGGLPAAVPLICGLMGRVGRFNLIGVLGGVTSSPVAAVIVVVVVVDSPSLGDTRSSSPMYPTDGRMVGGIPVGPKRQVVMVGGTFIAGD